MGLLPQAPPRKAWLVPLGAPPSKKRRTTVGSTIRMLRIFLVCCICVLIVGVPFSYQWLHEHILPGIYIDGVHVGEKNRVEAIALLNARGLYTPPKEIVVEHEGATFRISTKELGITQNPDLSVDEALQFGKKGSWSKNLADMMQLVLQDKHFHVARSVRLDALQTWIDSIAKAVNKPGKKAALSLKTSGNPQSLNLFIGQDGKEVQKDALREAVLAALNNTSKASIDPIGIPMDRIAKLTPEQSEQIKERARPIVGKKLQFIADDVALTLNDQKIISTFALPTGLSEKEVENIVLGWATQLERATQEPSITVVGKTVTAFTPPRTGRSLDTASSKAIVLREIQRLEHSQSSNEQPIILPIVSVKPEKNLGEMNSLGIQERIGYAMTTFYHSIPGRVHNVDLVGKNVNLEIIPPGAVFSYNKAIGEVSRATGFQPAYIIQAGRTVLGDGGGMCQGSTTLFRAALSAGLPILERRGHSYRVGYYEQNSLPGIDATAFSPSPDFKFSNDTPGHILVTASVDKKNYTMIIEFWGTSDGRIATISDHRVFDPKPARATVYQDDPSLPAGTLKQIDWSAPGAKTSFHYTVKRGGNVLQDRVFTTVYQPWAAVYLRGTRQ